MLDWEWSSFALIVFTSIVSLFGFGFWLLLMLWKHYPVNCWFCNQNSKVQFNTRNSWFCHKCQQYNGFTADGDYNKSLYQNMQPSNKIMYNYNKFPLRPASNGLCYKCNRNQQLKVMQLANFKPMNQNNFDSEVEQFKSHLEDVYKLCRKCKKFLYTKLQNEKGAFINPRKHLNKQNTTNSPKTFTFFKSLSLKGTYIFLCCVVINICLNANLYFSKKVIRVVKQYVSDVLNVVNCNNLLSENLINASDKYKETFMNLTIVNSTLNLFNERVTQYLTVTWTHQQLTIVALQTLIFCILMTQVIIFILETKKSFRTLFNVSLWIFSGYLSWTENMYLLILQPPLVSIVIWNTKVSSTSNNNNNNGKVWKNMKNLSESSVLNSDEDDDLLTEDSDFDETPTVNNRTSTPEYHFNNHTNHSFDNSSQIYRPYGFQINNVPSHFKLSQYDDLSSCCATELDRGIGTLSLGNRSVGSHNILSPSYYNSPSPNSSMCSPTVSSRRPVLSPSRFVYSTQQSWVAGGYWGTESPKKTHPSHDTSRSSSQSSGFESMTSGNHKKGYFIPFRVNGQTQNVPNNKSDELVCDKSVDNYSLRNGNVFLNANKSVPNIKSPCSGFLLKECFINPNPNNSFIPLDKAN